MEMISVNKNMKEGILMKYVSKTEFNLYLRSKLEKIEVLEWDKITPISSFNSNGGGIMLLLDKEENLIFVSATNDFNRRLGELFDKENTNGRFNNVAYIQIARINDRNGRFNNRRNFKETIELIDVDFANVLDDDDPRIQAMFRELEEIRQSALLTSES